jgi:hypothetical protein
MKSSQLSSENFRERALHELAAIRGEVLDLATDRDIYWKVEQEVIQRNRRLLSIRSAYLDMVRGSYADAVSSRVRRLIDRDQQTISLRKLLVELKEYPKLLPEGFSPEELERDIEELDRTASKIKGFVDQHVAHHQRNPVAVVPTHSELNAGINTLIAVFRKYYAILAGSDLSVVVDYLEEPLAIFRFPWIEPKLHS